MGKNKKQQSPADDLHQTLSDFTSKENWDKFFTLRGSDDAFEWYAEWPELKESLLSELASISPDAAAASYSLQILVPGCGNSKLSEHLYDGGFHGITNIDFSKVVISDMLRRNVRERPAMRWRVMDMTSMQFADNMFDAIVDKGGLDALMEPEHGQKLGSQYLMEAMRVLKSGGKFICLTLAESHVLGLLFSTLRFGWKMIIHAIPQKPSNKRSFRTFMVVAVKETHGVVHQITSSFDQSTLNCDDRQASGLYEELKNENKVRMDYSNGSDILLSLGDLRLGAKGNLDELCPGRRVLLNLGDHNSQFSYRAVLLDARQQSASFLCDCGVMLVPKSRSHGWLYSTEEGQWTVVESAKAARLIMVFLDNIHMKASMDDIQRDLSPLIKQLAPATNKYGSQIPFMMIDDALKERKLVHEVSSSLIGPIVIDDVVYNNVDNGVSHILPQQDLIFRRLIFQRNEDLVQSEALLMRQGSTVKNSGDKRSSSSSRSKKKGDHRSNGSEQTLRICHDYLASPYHTGIISGFMLISSHLEAVASRGRAVRAAVIGLGAGLLPMFLHGCMSFMHVEVVELDPVIVSLAKKYFSFCDDNRLKVHVTDGVEFVKAVASNSLANGDSPDKTESHDSFYSSDMISPKSLLEDKGNRMDILIVDVDSDDPSSGLSCPAANFVEEPFLNDAKNSISRQGLFVVNLVSRSAAIKETVISRMKKVFNHLYSLRLEEDVNEIIFAVKTDSHITDDLFSEAAVRLEKLLSCRDPKMSQTIIDVSKKIRYLK